MPHRQRNNIRPGLRVAIVLKQDQRTGRRTVILGAVYAALERLERNGLVTSRMGHPSPERGGRAKRFFDVTPQGLKAVKDTQRSLVALWKGVAQLKGGTA